MIRRWVWFTVCAFLGLVMLVCGLLVPAHLRAVDKSVIQKAARRSTGLIEHGLALVNEKKLGPAQLTYQAAQQEEVPNRDKLGLALTNAAVQHPAWQTWGDAETHLEILFGKDHVLPKSGSLPFTEFVLRQDNRARAMALLRVASRPASQELLRCRELTNTAIFSPSLSASGQALDAALSICGLLIEEGQLTPKLSEAFESMALAANRGGNSERLEQALLDLMSLGQRFNWGQLVAFANRIEDAETLRRLANFVRKADGQLAVLFSAVEMSGRPAEVASYLLTFSESGLKDLGASLRFGAGGVNALLERNQRLYSSSLVNDLAGYDPFTAWWQFAVDCCWRNPGFALSMKWALYLAGGFLIAAALHFARPAVSTLERPLQVRGFHIAREILFALGFLVVVLLLSEPFLAQESQKVEFPFRLRLPTVGSTVPAGSLGVKTAAIMNQLDQRSLLTLLLFFVLQGLIYISCLFKLAEIRRQRVPSRIKLRLLENEEHLFDAGLYLGFAGTIISLILVSLGFIKPSLMAAYSSTSFGIIFVSIFKIFHLRPARRKILLEAESTASDQIPQGVSRPLAAPL